MAKLADAADLKSAGPKGLWGFDSPSRHHLLLYSYGLQRDPLTPGQFSLVVGICVNEDSDESKPRSPVGISCATNDPTDRATAADTGEDGAVGVTPENVCGLPGEWGGPALRVGSIHGRRGLMPQNLIRASFPIVSRIPSCTLCTTRRAFARSCS